MVSTVIHSFIYFIYLFIHFTIVIVIIKLFFQIGSNYIALAILVLAT